MPWQVAEIFMVYFYLISVNVCFILSHIFFFILVSKVLVLITSLKKGSRGFIILQVLTATLHTN